MSVGGGGNKRVTVKPGPMNLQRNSLNVTNESEKMVEHLQRESIMMSMITEDDCKSTTSYLKKQLELFNIERYKIDNEMKVTFEFLEDILIVERNTCKAVIMGLINEDGAKGDTADSFKDEDFGELKQLNEACWPHSVVSEDMTFNEPLN